MTFPPPHAVAEQDLWDEFGSPTSPRDVGGSNHDAYYIRNCIEVFEGRKYSLDQGLFSGAGGERGVSERSSHMADELSIPYDLNFVLFEEPRETVVIIELGPGEVTKELLRTASLAETTTSIRYIAIDVHNDTLSDLADLNRISPKIHVHCLWGHFDDALKFIEERNIADEAVITCSFDSTIFDDLEGPVVERLRRWSALGDLIIGQDARKSEEDVEAAYTSDLLDHGLRRADKFLGRTFLSSSNWNKKYEYDEATFRISLTRTGSDPIFVAVHHNEEGMQGIARRAGCHLNPVSHPSGSTAHGYGVYRVHAATVVEAPPYQYLVGDKIGSGSFSVVYEAFEITNGKKFAAKIFPQSRGTAHPDLRHEYSVYRELRGHDCFAEVHGFVRERNYDCMIMDYLEDSLAEEMHRQGGRVYEPMAYLLAIQLIQAIQKLHKAGYIHRDIKPENISFKPKISSFKNGTRAIVLNDMGMARKHTEVDGAEDWHGTPRWASLNVHDGKTQCRRDDLISAVYVILSMLVGRLPWEGLRQQSPKRKRGAIRELKASTDIRRLHSGVGELSHRVSSLRFDEEPPYDAYISLVEAISRPTPLSRSVSRSCRIERKDTLRSILRCISLARQLRARPMKGVLSTADPICRTLDEVILAWTPTAEQRRQARVDAFSAVERRLKKDSALTEESSITTGFSHGLNEDSPFMELLKEAGTIATTIGKEFLMMRRTERIPELIEKLESIRDTIVPGGDQLPVDFPNGTLKRPLLSPTHRPLKRTSTDNLGERKDD